MSLSVLLFDVSDQASEWTGDVRSKRLFPLGLLHSIEPLDGTMGAPVLGPLSCHCCAGILEADGVHMVLLCTVYLQGPSCWASLALPA